MHMKIPNLYGTEKAIFEIFICNLEYYNFISEKEPNIFYLLQDERLQMNSK